MKLSIMKKWLDNERAKKLFDISIVLLIFLQFYYIILQYEKTPHGSITWTTLPHYSDMWICEKAKPPKWKWPNRFHYSNIKVFFDYKRYNFENTLIFEVIENFEAILLRHTPPEMNENGKKQLSSDVNHAIVKTTRERVKKSEIWERKKVSQRKNAHWFNKVVMFYG